MKAYQVSFGGEYSVLAWAETRNKARALCVGYYARPEDEPYTCLSATRLPHMDGHLHAPESPCVMDGYGCLPHEWELVNASFIYRCRNCGEVSVEDYLPCDCTGGQVAFDAECRRYTE